MQATAVKLADRFIEMQVEMAHILQHATKLWGGICHRAEILFGAENLMGDIQPNHLNARAGCKNHFGRMRVMIDIGLSIGRDIAAFFVGSAHQDDARNVLGKFGIQLDCQSDIGEWTYGA